MVLLASHRFLSIGIAMPVNPYVKAGYIGSGRQVYDQYESLVRGSPRSVRGDSKITRSPGSTAGLDRRLKSPQTSPKREKAKSASPSKPSASPPKPSTSSPKPSTPPPKPSASPPKPSASPPKAASNSPPPPPPPADPELHELKELFAAPAKPDPPREPPGAAHAAEVAELLPLHPGYSAAFKEHLTFSPRTWKPVSKPKDAIAPPTRPQPVQHTRAVVSKYGGMIAKGSTLYIVPQPWEDASPRLSEQSVTAFKAKPNFSKAGAVVTDDQGANRKDGYAGRSGSTNMTLCEAEPSFRARSQPVGTVVQPGVPGYTGHVPHGVGTEAHVVKGRENHTPQVANFETTLTQHRALDHSRPNMPKKGMPPPGYQGHIHMTKNSHEAFGTSRWQPAVPVSHEPRVRGESEGSPGFTSGWPLSSGVADAMPVGGKSAAAVESRYEQTIKSLGNF